MTREEQTLRDETGAEVIRVRKTSESDIIDVSDGKEARRSHWTAPLTRQQEDMLSLFESAKDTDITFLFEDGRKIFAHKKVILTARATYFANMFHSGMTEASSNEIRVQDIEPEVFKAVLQHLYSGAAPVNLAEIALEVHAAADKYGLDELKELCESCVCDNLTADNVVDVFVYAEERSCVKIRDKALVVLRENMETLSQESANKLKNNPTLLFQLAIDLARM